MNNSMDWLATIGYLEEMNTWEHVDKSSLADAIKFCKILQEFGVERAPFTRPEYDDGTILFYWTDKLRSVQLGLDGGGEYSFYGELGQVKRDGDGLSIDDPIPESLQIVLPIMRPSQIHYKKDWTDRMGKALPTKEK